MFNQFNQGITGADKKALQAAFISKVYGWMSIALVVTAAVAMWAASTPAVANFVMGSRFGMFLLIGAEIGLVFYITTRLDRLTVQNAGLLFLVYAVLNGLTMSVIFFIYLMGSIATTFWITALTFGLMSFYGYTTKKDLTSWGNLAFMALIGIIIGSLVNFFLKSTMLYWLISYAGVLIFVGLTAYDTQKIKNSVSYEDGQEIAQKKAIMGALMLYLDFVNMFIYLLRILGDRRN